MSDPTLLYRAERRVGWGFVLYLQDYFNDADWSTALKAYKTYMLADYTSDDQDDDESVEDGKRQDNADSKTSGKKEAGD
jgi:hypothetical protein